MAVAVLYNDAESKALSYGKIWDSDSETPGIDTKIMGGTNLV